MEKITLSIVIVHYNTPQLLKTCLNSIYSVKKDDDLWEVIVVDNGSTRETRDEIRQYLNIEQFKPFLQILFENENHGFSGGNYIAIKKTKGEYVLLLNSDTEIQSDAIQQTLRVFSDQHVGAATCKLLLPNGSIDPACHRGFPTPWTAFTYFAGLERLFPFIPFFCGYHQLYKGFSTTHEIDVPSGAFFMVRREVLDSVGLLDEQFFMYGEDIDWAYRIKQKGYKIVFTPNGVVLHRKKQSGRESADSNTKKKTDTYFYETMKLFYIKHYRSIYPQFVMNSILCLLTVRIWIVKNIN